jgi:predicted membrane protein
MEVLVWILFSVIMLVIACITELYECILMQKTLIKQYELKLQNYEKEYKNVRNWRNVKGQNSWN